MIELDSVGLQVGTFKLVDVSFTIPAGGYAALVGKTGAGKSTLLEAICGLRQLTSGKVLLSGVDVTTFPPAARGIGYLPQDLCLFPPLTVQEHLEFVPRLQSWPSEMRRQRVVELAAALQLTSVLFRKPAGLSGGEAQRVGLGRALASHPRILLLDEPLSALDPQTRSVIRDVIQNDHREHQLTVLHVTHRLEEISPLADMVLTLSEGKVTVREERVRG